MMSCFITKGNLVMLPFCLISQYIVKPFYLTCSYLHIHKTPTIGMAADDLKPGPIISIWTIGINI